MHVTLGVLLALWGGFLVLFSRRIARGQHSWHEPGAGSRRAAETGTHRYTTVLNAVVGIAIFVCGVLVALRVMGR